MIGRILTQEKKTYTQETENTYQVEKVSKSEFIRLAKTIA